MQVNNVVWGVFVKKVGKSARQKDGKPTCAEAWLDREYSINRDPAACWRTWFAVSEMRCGVELSCCIAYK